MTKAELGTSEQQNIHTIGVLIYFMIKGKFPMCDKADYSKLSLGDTDHGSI